ncbi:MAG: hypothetical protein E6Q97_21115 [Desulfurellales bacterium]|nr:MAG: hypothetical protein E6Q97_21115 [Desulfurellales bacterium]
MDFRTGEVDAAAMTFGLSLDAAALGHFFKVEPPIAARLASAISGTATTIILTSNTLTNTTIYLEREAIRLGGTATPSGGNYSYSCTRGVLGTQAQAHDSGVNDDTAVYSALPLSTLAGRIVEFFRVPTSGDYDDESARWMGRLRAVEWAADGERGGTVTLRVDSALQSLKGTKIYRNPWRGRVADVRQNQDTDHAFWVLVIEAQGTVEPASASNSTVLIDDYAAFRLESVALPTSPTEIGRAPIGLMEPLAGAVFPLDAPEIGAEIREIFTSDALAPSGVRLSNEAGILALQLLLTTENGGNHATYDLGHRQIAGSVPASLVDISAFLDWNERVKAFPFDAFHVGHDSADPLDLFDTLQRRILQPFAASLIQGANGKISVASLADAVPYGTANTLLQSALVRGVLPKVQTPLFDTVDRVAVLYNDRPVVGPDRITAVDVRKSQRAPFGEHDTLELDLRAVTTRPLAAEIAQRFVQRFHLPIPVLSLSAVRSAEDLWIGQAVAVTLEHVPNAGARGVTAGVFLVVGRQEDLTPEAHALALDLLFVGQAASTSYIAPSARVSAVSGSGPSYTLTVEANAYTDPDYGPLGLDAAGFTSGDVAQLCDEFGAVRDASVNIGTVSGSSIPITNCAVTPAVGDVLRVAAYTGAATAQKTTWAFIADASDTLGSDPAKEYTTA